jgi:hypothetical protein
MRFVLLESAAMRFAPLRSASRRSGRTVGFSRRHAFQAVTPFISWAMWSGLAMPAKSFGKYMCSSGAATARPTGCPQ